MRNTRRHRGGRHPRGFISRLTYAFRERQIYLRSEGEVQFITLRPAVQIAVILAFTIGLFWVAYATVNVAFKDQVLALKERNQYRARLEYEDRIGEMRSTIDKLNRRLLLDQKTYLAKVDEVRIEHDRLVDRHIQLSEFFRQGWLPEPKGSTRQLKGSLSPQEVAPDVQTAARTVSPRASDRFTTEFTSPEEALRPLDELREYMAQMEVREAKLLDNVTEYVAGRTTRLGKVYVSLGVNADKLAKSSKYKPEAIGGPFVAASTGDLGSKVLARSVSGLSAQLERWETLKFQSTRLPLVRPMSSEHKVSSSFGLRKDPFRKRPAMHSGVDFRGATGSPVYVTAPGTVTKAGRAGGYGKMVEVRHDGGIISRYAHLSIISVRTGQKVKSGDRIGKVGSTGRSTGPHLHYETRVGGRAIDPVRFWKARDVFQEITR
ncbi:MAG: peptidoglycan DD-metalloendopeptidase family protein [Anderseniella sp.]